MIVRMFEKPEVILNYYAVQKKVQYYSAEYVLPRLIRFYILSCIFLKFFI